MTQPKSASWQESLINAVTDPKELLELLELDMNLLKPLQAAANRFPLVVPRKFLSHIKKGDANDPLLKQFLPIANELEEATNFEADPLQESTFNPVPGLLHKYSSRVLLTLTGTCAINCRYCFRREFPYEKNNPGSIGWEKAIDYIANNSEINEVILSGGDPLVASDTLLKSISEKISRIPHITRLRIHSRIPIVLPERITEDFIQSVSQPTFKTIMVTHANHPNEIDISVKNAMKLLSTAGITLLNQSVLLKDVNDNAETLVQLSEKLFDAGVLPYYLHVLDKVKGTAHFDLNREVAKQIHRDIAKHLPGFLVPKLVCEQPGAPSKTSLFT